MTLGQYTARVSHREHLLWLAYLGRHHQPSLDQWYLMQIAAEIRMIRFGFAENPPPVRLADLKLKFVAGGQPERPEQTPEQAEALFLARMGLVGKAKEEAIARGKGEAPAGRPKGTGKPKEQAMLVAPAAKAGKLPVADGRTWEELAGRRRRGNP